MIDTQKLERQTQGEWSIEEIEGQPILVIIDPQTKEPRTPNREEAERAVNVLNENNGSTVVKLFCRTEGCSEKGGFIVRAVGDAAKNLYSCDVCRKPMQK